MIKVEYMGKIYTFDGKRINVGSLLDKLSLNPETHLVVVNGELRTEDEFIMDGENCKIIRVISGG